jgi:glucose-1-phosphate thymidylyltransferase
VNGNLSVRVLDRGKAWLDIGAFESLMQASQFVQVIEERQGLKIESIEEAANRLVFIIKKEMTEITKPLLKSAYGESLMKL